jgi:hypothetical protein
MRRFLTQSRRYLRFSIDGRFTVNFNQVASYAASNTVAQRRFPKKRSVIISQSPTSSQAAAVQFPDAALLTTKTTLPNRIVGQLCDQLGDCLEALHARTSRLVQTPPAAAISNPDVRFFKGGFGTTGRAYDNEVLLEPIFQALPAMEHLLSVVVPFTQPMTITSSLGLGVQNRWIPDETDRGCVFLTSFALSFTNTLAARLAASATKSLSSLWSTESKSRSTSNQTSSLFPK